VRTILLTLLPTMALAACASTPYADLAWDVKNTVRYVEQENDQHVYGCRETGDCDDRALCAACKLVQSGANPDDILVVFEYWERLDQRNHMALEYDGHCILGYSSLSHKGPCAHPLRDDKMRTTRVPLSKYIKHGNVINECHAMPGKL
jgi:hypothetical protein